MIIDRDGKTMTDRGFVFVFFHFVCMYDNGINPDTDKYIYIRIGVCFHVYSKRKPTNKSNGAIFAGHFMVFMLCAILMCNVALTLKGYC